MKKLLLVTMLLVTSIVTQAEPLWYKLNNVSSKVVSENVWSAWTSVSINMTMDFERKRIVIYSQKIQVIDYVSFEPGVFDEGTTFSGLATDSNYKTVRITLFYYNSKRMLLKVSYSDFEYIYEIVEFN